MAGDGNQQPNTRLPQRDSLWRNLQRWWVSDAANAAVADDDAQADRIQWLRVIPFVLLHLGCLGVLWVGVSATAVAVALALYLLRMFAITGFYHRYFSHRAFKASRPVQLGMALLGASAVQRGPLWWASHHRHHHRHADTAQDLHAPARGFWRSHMGWFLTKRGYVSDHTRVQELAKFPELRWLDTFDVAVPLGLALGLYATGEVLAAYAPQLGTNGAQLLVWGFFISTVVLFHASVTINSLSHRFGRRRFATKDDSRNNLWLALLTLGEGWHNNHHFFPGSARQGFMWWEVDITWYLLKAMQRVGLISDLKPVPAWVMHKRGAL